VNRPRRLLLTLAAGLLACGCHNFTIVNGKAPMEKAASGYDDKFHSAVIGDLVMIDPPVRLEAVCPQGWAQIDRRVTFLDGLIGMLAGASGAGGAYKADSVTVKCAQAAAPAL
jgi:hypothetical protein